MSGFKKFLLRGNVVDLAVAIVIGVAFTAVIQAFVKGFITPLLGVFGGLGYLPAKFKIRFLEPIPTDQWGEEPWQDRGLIQTVADEIRGRVQEELIDMLAHRRSVWFG